VFQLCVTPGSQRQLVGATLLREAFDRSAYGCRLYCCWCAQDLAANYFWESLGFVPLAFRVGSGRKKRLHIFWQRRIDSHSVTPSPNHSVTPAPYWYPFQTSSGAIRADGLVFPIPPGVRWQDVKAIEMPTVARAECSPQARPCLEGPKTKNMGGSPMPRKTKSPQNTANMVAIIVGGRVKYVPKPGATSGARGEGQGAREETMKTKKRARRDLSSRSPLTPRPSPLTYDPRFLKQNRELRDRYLERVNDRLLIAPCAKYDVSRTLSGVEGSRALADAHVFKAALPSPAAA
jgi:hypothetical protein